MITENLERVIKENSVKCYVENFKIVDKDVVCNEEFYSDLEIEFINYEMFGLKSPVGRYAFSEWSKEKKQYKITCNDYYINKAVNNLKQYYAKNPSKLSEKGAFILEVAYNWLVIYLIARELYEWLFLKIEGVEAYEEKTESANRMLVAMKHFFAMSCINEEDERAIIVWISKFLDIEKEKNYPISMMYYGDKLFEYRNKNFAGEKKKGNEFLLYCKLVELFKESKYDEGIHYLINSVTLEDKRKVSLEEYNTFVQEFHPDNNSQMSELEKNALLFLWDDCKMFRHTYPSYYIVDEALLCMYNAVYTFMKTGSKDDAIDIYNCYSRKFLKSDKMQEFINMISSYESNASRLVQSHRDHYSHSAYVFILGMAIYHTNAKYRMNFYNVHFGQFKLSEIPENGDAAKCFLERDYIDFYCGSESGDMNFLRLWGLTSLFHDIGYQYEIPFEQIKNTSGNEIYFQYKNFEKFTDFNKYFSECEKKGLWDEISRIFKDVKDYIKRLFLYEETEDIQSYVESDKCAIEEIIAYHIRRFIKREYSPEIKALVLEENGYVEDNAKEISDLEFVARLLKLKPTPKAPYMDHAYFSGIITFRELITMFGPDEFPLEFMDAITAIIMHNKFFEFCLKNTDVREEDKNGNKRKIKVGTPLKLEEHPLAYLLILCDELQCWDRTSFGKGSIKEMHAIDAKVKFEHNKGLEVEYIYDRRFAKDAFSFDSAGNIAGISKGSLAKFYMYKDSGEEKIFTPSSLDKENYETYKVKSTEFIDLGKDENISCKFYKGIADIVELDGENVVGVNVSASFGEKDKLKKEYLSETSIRNLYDTAKTLFERMNTEKSKSFEYTTLMEKLAYISFVRNMGKGLHEIGCFYTNKTKVFDIKEAEDFTTEEKIKIFNVEKCMLDEFCERHLIEKFSDEEIEKMVDECITVLCDSRGIEIYKLW